MCSLKPPRHISTPPFATGPGHTEDWMTGLNQLGAFER
jgi:hypothetical protein